MSSQARLWGWCGLWPPPSVILSAPPSPSRSLWTHVSKLPSLCSLCTRSNCMAWGEINQRRPKWFWKGEERHGRGTRKSTGRRRFRRRGVTLLKQQTTQKEAIPAPDRPASSVPKCFFLISVQRQQGRDSKHSEEGGKRGFGLLAYYKKAHP